jgi:hypothetical protein
MAGVLAVAATLCCCGWSFLAWLHLLYNIINFMECFIPANLKIDAFVRELTENTQALIDTILPSLKDA